MKKCLLLPGERLYRFTMFVACAIHVSPAAAEMVLVEDGVARATIVISGKALTGAPDPEPAALGMPQAPANKIAAAARDLQTYVVKITGADLRIVGDATPPAGPLILIGKSALTRSLDDKIPAGLSPQRDEEGFVILSQGDRLLLAGNDEGPYHGTEYAVSELLHRLGVRWYMPGDFGEVVPQQKTIAFPAVEVQQRPDFRIRNWLGYAPPAESALEYRWKIRNKLNPTVNLIAAPQDGSVGGFLPADTEQTNPQALALGPDGKRIKTLPNLSHPQGVEVVARAMKEHFRAHPEETSFGISLDDGLPRDFDPATVRRNLGFPEMLGRPGVSAEVSCTEEWIEFVNRVAREVRREYPDHIITTTGYANRNSPPHGVTVEENVWLLFAAIWSDTFHAFDDPKSWQMARQGQMLRQWREVCPHIFMYNYAYATITSAGTPVPLSRKHCRDLPLLKQWGIVGFLDEWRAVHAESGIYPRYLRAHLMWDAGLDADALLAEFFADWYGQAAQPARAFWDALERALEETPLLGHDDRILPFVYTPELIARLDQHVAEAERLADGDAVKIRVRVDRLILEHLQAYLAMTAAEWATDFAAAAEHAQRMLTVRGELHDINSFLFLGDGDHETGYYFWPVTARRDHYRKWADRTTGVTGDLVAVLAETTPFRIDPRDEGRFAGWYKTDVPTADWRPIRTTRPYYAQDSGGTPGSAIASPPRPGRRPPNRPIPAPVTVTPPAAPAKTFLDETGYPTFLGPMWYRFTVDVPAVAKDRKVLLYIPAVETEAHVWVNGQFVGHRPYREATERPNDLELDVTTALQPDGMNTIAIRVNTGMNAASAPGGMISRGFLYSPRP